MADCKMAVVKLKNGGPRCVVFHHKGTGRLYSPDSLCNHFLQQARKAASCAVVGDRIMIIITAHSDGRGRLRFGDVDVSQDEVEACWCATWY
jgi:hypothetical protein